MKILVTGGAGYIGSVIVEKLIERGDDVIVYDNLSTGFKKSVPDSVKFILGDIRDDQLLTRVLKDHKVEAVIHMAAKSVVTESIENPNEYYDHNVNGTLQLLKACDAAQIQNLVFSSSASVYGNSLASPVPESAPLQPINPYGMSKLMGEKMIQDYAVSKKLKYILLRYFNVAGAMLNMKQGQRLKTATSLIKVASQVAVGEKESLQIFGDQFGTQDGTAERDYIHVEDLADLHLLALDYLSKNNDSQILNCGYGVGFSVKQVVSTMEDILGRKIAKSICPPRAGDPAQVFADSQKIKKLFQWTPKRHDLRLIIQSSLDWEKLN